MSFRKISVVLPCRNEEKTIGICIDKIKLALKNYNYEIIVSDSSIDNSASIAKKKGAILIKHKKVGYGNAYLEGFKKISGDVVILGDADNTYDFSEIPKLLTNLKNDNLVLGKRKYIKKGAMPTLHRYFGNPILSATLSLLFNSKVKDSHSGFRAITTLNLKKLNLHTAGMEFASEMIIKALKTKLKITEVPIHYYPRLGISKLNSFRDGWRHLRFMLLYSPAYLFFLPGILLFFTGLFGLSISAISNSASIYTSIISSLILTLGFQLVFLTLFAKIYLYAVLKEDNKFLAWLTNILSIERGMLIGGLISIIGLIVGLYQIINFMSSNAVIRPQSLIFVSTIIIIGIQLVFNVFYLSVLGIEKR